MVSKVLVALCIVMAVASAVPAEMGGWGTGGWGSGGWGAGGWGAGGGAAGAGVNPWLPPWISTAPWYPAWVPCSTIGSACLDCTTKVVCTKIGGIQRACTDPTLPFCNLGECSATATAECTPPAVPAAAGAV